MDKMTPELINDPGLTIALFHGIRRSGHWSTIEKNHLKKQPSCIVCGVGPHTKPGVKLQVHHKYPFHFVSSVGRPDLELDERNLYTMCMEEERECHLVIGHLGSFLSYNPRLEYFVSLCRGLLIHQIKSMREWNDAVSARPIPLEDMCDQKKHGLLMELNRYMPLVKSATGNVVLPGPGENG